MSIYITILLMALVVIVLILFPLWFKKNDRSLGKGLEDTEELSDWITLKNQLTKQLTELDLAMPQDKIDTADFEKEKQQLLAKAEQTLNALQQTRHSNQNLTDNHAERTYPIFGIVCGFFFVIGTIGLTAYLGSQPLNRNVSPHKTSQNTLLDQLKTKDKQKKIANLKSSAKTETHSPHSDKKKSSPQDNKKSAASILGTDGKPDIQAMVARLEAKVKKPSASLKEVMMLARSYWVLGKKQEAIKLYQRAVTLAPNDAVVILTSGQYIYQSNDKEIQLKGEALFDRLLASRPNFPEAMWLKSLSLVKRHEVSQAKNLLTKLIPLVAEKPKAKKAVTQLLATLNEPRKKP